MADEKNYLNTHQAAVLLGLSAKTLSRYRVEAATGLAVRFVGAARADERAAFAAPDGLSPNGGIWTGPLDRLLDSWTCPCLSSWTPPWASRWPATRFR